MKYSYTKEIAIQRGPKTINAMMIFGRYRDPKVFEIIFKSLISAILLTGAGILSALMVLM